MLLTEEEKKENRKIALKKYYETHKAEVHKRNTEWGRVNPDKRSEYTRRSAEKNKKPPVVRVKLTDAERKLSRQRTTRKYYENNTKSIAEKKRGWRLSRPDLYRTYSNKRRSLKEANGTFAVTDKDLSRMINRQNGECFWCGDKLTEYHMDHVIPVSRGGSHSIGNLVASCPYCNRSKHNKLPIEFKLLMKQRA